MSFRGASGSSKQRRLQARRLVESRTKRVLEDKECGNGLYWCDHVYEPDRPWKWVDIIFLSKKYSKHHYYAAALSTLEYSQYWEDDEAAWAYAEKVTGPIPDDEPWEDVVAWLSRPTTDEMKKRLEIQKAELTRLMAIPRLAKPYTKLCIAEYRPGCIGVHAAINTISLNDTVIRQFIQQFYELGEPIHEGIIWTGEEVLVTPADIDTPDAER